MTKSFANTAPHVGNEKSAISARKTRSSVQELMAKPEHIRSGSGGWSNQPRLERGNLPLTKVWFDRDWQVHPERKHRGCEVVTRWDETAAGQTGKQHLKVEHLGSVTHIRRAFPPCQHTSFLQTHGQTLTCACWLALRILLCGTRLHLSPLCSAELFALSKCKLEIKPPAPQCSFTCSVETCHYRGNRSNYLITPPDTRY